MGKILENPFPFGNAGGLQQGVVDPDVVAGATAMPAPQALITKVSGSAAVATIALPWPAFTGVIKYISVDGALTGVTGGSATDSDKPLAAPFTTIANEVLELACDGNFWYPSLNNNDI